MSSERIWDFTAIDTFQTCRRKFYWRMVRHLEPKGISSALVFGAAIHSALDTYYTDGLVKALSKFSESFTEIEGEEARTKANGIKLLEWYAKVYANEPFKVIAKPEVGFVIPLGEHLWGGRMDLPVEWDGQLWIMEHKTTTRMDANYFKQFQLDKQITSYVVGAEEYLGRKCAGCLVNGLEVWKELKRPTPKSKTPEQHFVRDPIIRSDMLKERFKLNVARIIRDILWCEANNEFYEAEKRDVCFSYNSECPYATLCKYGEDERIIANDYNVKPWKPYEEVTDDKPSKSN